MPIPGQCFQCFCQRSTLAEPFSPAMEVGGNRCLSKKLRVIVTDGNLTVGFEAVKGMTFLNGIKLFRIG